MRGKNKFLSPWFVLLFAMAVVFLLLFLQPNPPQEQPAKPPAVTLKQRASLSYRETQRAAALQTPPAPTTNAYVMLTNQPMRLAEKVIVARKWNDGPDAFGLDKPAQGLEGATVGPAAVTYFQDNLYVLDNANKRILGYNKSGKLVSSIPLPNNLATDLFVDASGSALVLIDHMNNSIYKVDGNQLVLIGSVPLKEGFPLGTKFSYDLASNTLAPQEVHQDGLADIDGNNLVVNMADGKKFAIGFDRPVACIEELATDANGIVWVLYTLEGDFRMRRLARVDRNNGTAGITEINAWFAFDATRHMTITPDGVALFTGDTQEGRLVSFDYHGSGS